MFGIWSVIGEVLEREHVRFNSLLGLVLRCVSSGFDPAVASPDWFKQGKAILFKISLT